ncbi:NUDIX domain-containing protein [Plantactinospora siamensis]|uniref:NUDIX domain-containing protein n=1 Tax=Plantactinospora siamensis TaxID=555372 RepID=A0ABV6NRY5_9ACTN
MTGAPYSHCSYCGTAYPAGAGWPRACVACGQLVWRNPLPVAVAILPVRTDDGLGVVVQRRDIEPARGLLSLPGGFIEYGEDWQDALVRELREETNLIADADAVRLYSVLSAPAGGSLLIFGELPEVSYDDLPPSRPTEESTEWLVLTEPAELAFSTHSDVLADFLARHRA